MKMASWRRLRISIIPMTLALTMCLSAVMNGLSSFFCSFHQPYLAEKTAQMNISLIGVNSWTHGKRSANAAGIIGEQAREIRILEIADPVGHAEVAQIHDRGDFAALEIGEGQVGEFPVELARPEIGLVDRRTVAEEIDADFLDAVEILAPPFVMAADRHLIDARLAVVDGRDAVFDPGREHEVGDRSISSA